LSNIRTLSVREIAWPVPHACQDSLRFGLALLPSSEYADDGGPLVGDARDRGAPVSGKGDAAYNKALGQRLRAIRVQQGLSLHGVEKKSEGRWKGVVVGSYERGSRAVTVQRLAELADFYGVPVAELLPESASVAASVEPGPRLVLDLERLQELPSSDAGPLARYTAALQSQRGDYNGRVMSIRQDDLRTLAVIYDDSPIHLAETLVRWGVLRTTGTVVDLR
jgi:transcriptional regulator with XRE-family HTH domain